MRAIFFLGGGRRVFLPKSSVTISVFSQLFPVLVFSPLEFLSLSSKLNAWLWARQKGRLSRSDLPRILSLLLVQACTRRLKNQVNRVKGGVGETDPSSTFPSPKYSLPHRWGRGLDSEVWRRPLHSTPYRQQNGRSALSRLTDAPPDWNTVSAKTIVRFAVLDSCSSSVPSSLVQCVR